MKHTKITIVNTGGEYTGGSIEDADTIDNINDYIDEDNVSHNMEFDNGDEFEVINYDNFFHVYGPDINSANIIIEESDENGNYSTISENNIDDTDINQFITENPYYKDFVDKHNIEGLMVYSQKIEKRIHYSIVINEEFKNIDFSNLYIGAVNMDETIGRDEIVDTVLYIPKEKADEYVKKYLDGDYEDEPLSDFISEIFMENHELKQIIYDNHSIESDDIEGKGEWENEYIKITNTDDETLFEDGEY